MKLEKPLVSGFFYYNLVFEPEERLSPDTSYTINVRFGSIPSLFGLTTPQLRTFYFKTQATPRVTATNPQDKASGVSANQTFLVYLSEPNNHLAIFNFYFKPVLKFNANLSSDRKSYTITPTQPLRQGVKYELLIKKTPIKKYNLLTNEIIETEASLIDKKTSFTTTPPPKVKAVSAKGTSASTGPVKIEFNKEMNRFSVEKNLSFSPETEYTLAWENPKTLVLTPTQPLAYKTTYQIKIGRGTEAADGSFFEKDFNHKFTTLGNARVLYFSPNYNSWGINVKTNIQVAFDQKVDKESAQKHFSITPAVSGSFAWSGNTMKFSPAAPLRYFQTYSVTLSKGVKSLEALDSNQNFSAYFTTQAEYVNLPVPAYPQAFPLSCEFANMRMVLAYYGINQSETSLISQTPFDTTPRKGNVWGDPSKGFLGSVNGKWFVSGYGAYYPVLSSVLGRYRPVRAYTGWNLNALAKEIKAGNPVLIWGCSSCVEPTYWNTPTGKKIYAYKHYHIYTVRGYVGSINNPYQIIVNDSRSGWGEIRLSKEEFLSKWAAFNNTALVVR